MTTIALPTSMFTRVSYGCYLAEASDLNGQPFPDRIVLHDDADGYREVFDLAETQRDADGDVILWRYLATGAPRAIEILND